MAVFSSVAFAQTGGSAGSPVCCSPKGVIVAYSANCASPNTVSYTGKCLPAATPTPTPVPVNSGKDGRCCLRNADAGSVDCAAREQFTLQVLNQAQSLRWPVSQALTYSGACEFKATPGAPTCRWNQSAPECMPKLPTPTPPPTPVVQGSGRDGRCCVRNADAGSVDCAAREQFTLQVLTQASSLGWSVPQALAYTGACEYKPAIKSPTCRWNQGFTDCMPKANPAGGVNLNSVRKK